MNRSLVVAVPELLPEHIEKIRNAAERSGFSVCFLDAASRNQEALREAEVIFGSDPALSRSAPNLRWICATFAGINQFMAEDAFASPSAVLSNSSGAYGVTISEHIVMSVLMLLRNQLRYNEIARSHEWRRRLPTRSIHGSRVLMLGTGDIGREAAKRIRAFQPRQIIGVSRSGRNPDSLFDQAYPASSLDQLLPDTDLLIISLPGTAETFHLIGPRQLKLLPDHAILVNVGRGSVIDERALEAGLRSGRLSAALDVFETEPIPQDSPLWSCPRLLITPHVAGDTTLPYTLDRIVDLFLEDFGRYVAGLPLLRQVDRAAGY